MGIFYTIVFLPLAVWLVLVSIGVIFKIAISRNVAGLALLFCIGCILFPGLLVLGIVAVLCLGISLLLRHLSGVR